MRLHLGFALALPAPAAAAILHANGPLSTGPVTSTGSNAPPGTSWSELATPDNFVYGFEHTQANGSRIADDFTVPVGQTWRVSSFTVHAYQSGTGVGSPFTAATLRIWDAGGPGSGALLHGDTVTNVRGPTDWTAVYRTDSFGSTSSLVMRVSMDADDVILGPGTYWIDWALTGKPSLFNVWAPPVSILGVPGKPGGNAMQSTGGAFLPVTDADVGQDFPFFVNGVVIPAPSGLSILALAALARRRSR